MKKKNEIFVNGSFFPLFIICALAAGMLVSGCGGGGGQTGSTHAVTAAAPVARVTGMVLLETADAALGRAKGESVEDTRTAERAASQIAECGAVPAGYVSVPNAVITADNETGSTVTDASGCFQMDIYHMGRKVFTAVKTNTLGGTTTLKKVASVQPNSHVRFIEGQSGPLTILSTVAALIVEEKEKNGETIPDPDVLEAYVESIQDQDDVASLATAIKNAAQPGGDFNDIDAGEVSDVEAATDAPVMFGSSVTGGPVAAAGGDVQFSVKAACFGDDVSLQSVTAVLTATGQTPIEVPLTAAGDNVYSGSYNLPQNTGTTDVVYTVSFKAVDSNNVQGTSAPAGLTITQAGSGGGGGGAVCGNNSTETGETCDDGNTTTETCVYGETSCTVCNATCQNAAGTVVGYCGDNTTQAGEGEQCDDGNATTETCVYGETSCTVCDATCQNAAGTVVGYCGDNTTQAGEGEQCDDGNATTETCVYGETSCTVCDATCQNAAGTVVGYCGDNTTQAGEGETCDDGNATTETCAYGLTSCTVCNATCQSAAGATSYCGDNTVDAGNGEECDDGGTGGGDGCDSNCQTELFVLSQNMGSNDHYSKDFAVGDFNGDGAVDYFFSTYGSSYSKIFLNNGSGILADSGTLSERYFSPECTSADFDGDGDIDIAIAGLGRNNQLLLNNGSGVFANLGSWGGTYNYSIAVGDLDGDGDIDAIVGTDDEAISYFNDGAGNLSQSQVFAANTNGYGAAAIGDVDGDGDNDVALGGYAGENTVVWLNNGSGVFSDSGQVLGAYDTADIQLADLDSDGDLDLAQANYDENTVKIWQNNGSGVFTDTGQSFTGTNGSDRLAVGDFDLDGDLDIVMGVRRAPDFVLLNDGSGAFTQSPSFGNSQDAMALEAVDVDGDGDLDLLMGGDPLDYIWTNQTN